jgi:NifB/MoaA-like Fe-S oxidoreductase
VPFAIATGVAAAPFLRELVERAGASGTVYAIPNDFFGHNIEVAGLLTGGTSCAISGQAPGRGVLLPMSMLRHGEGVFLDDMTLEQLSQGLGVPVIPVECDGGKLLAAMRGQ